MRFDIGDPVNISEKYAYAEWLKYGDSQGTITQTYKDLYAEAYPEKPNGYRVYFKEFDTYLVLADIDLEEIKYYPEVNTFFGINAQRLDAIASLNHAPSGLWGMISEEEKAPYRLKALIEYSLSVGTK